MKSELHNAQKARSSLIEKTIEANQKKDLQLGRLQVVNAEVSITFFKIFYYECGINFYS